jgi:hypothetical protein
MLFLVLNIKTAWNDYFTTTNPNNLNSQMYTSRQTPSDTSVYVSNCLFRSIMASGNGGALSCTSVTNFLAESSSFFSCTTSSQRGGAIYFDNGGGQCVLHEVCGYDCFIYSCEQHRFKQELYYAANLYNGNICCSSANISLNKCHRRSAIGCWPSFDSNSVTCSFTYSSFADNIAADYNGILLYTVGANFEMKSCNILRNTQGSLDTDGTIYISGNLKIDDSCIIDNTATNIFYQTSFYTITLSKCSVDRASCYKDVVTQSTVTKSFILALNHMSTQNCHSGYDAIGILTPIIQSPSSSKKQINCYTHMNFFDQPRLTFVSTFIFVFNFINPCASCFGPK